MQRTDPAQTERRPSPRAGVAERIWRAAQIEFSRRGYHGARVQAIARSASCNVALMYRHWTSKHALYLDVLRAAWISAAAQIAPLLSDGSGDVASIAAGPLDAMLGDPAGAQILVREVLDGAPFLAQLAASEPSLVEPVRSASAAGGAPAHLGPALAVVTVAGIAALAAASRDAAPPLLGDRIPADAWRRELVRFLVGGLGGSLGPGGPKASAAP